MTRHRGLSDVSLVTLVIVATHGKHGLNVWPKTPGVSVKSLTVLADRGLITRPITCACSLGKTCDVLHGALRNGDARAFRRTRITTKGRRFIEAF